MSFFQLIHDSGFERFGVHKTEDFKHSKCAADLMPMNLPFYIVEIEWAGRQKNTRISVTAGNCFCECGPECLERVRIWGGIEGAGLLLCWR